MFLFISLIELIYTPCLLKRNKYLSKPQNNYSSKLSKVAVMSLAIFAVFISTFQQVFACRESSYLKFSNLYKWWKWTLQMIFFFSEWLVITTRWAKFRPDFHNYTELNGFVNSFSSYSIAPSSKLLLGCKPNWSAKRKKTKS